MDARGRWIFGYGSPVWRPAFPYVERRAPGRVLTPARRPEALCCGVAYRVEDAA
jgi:cation transport regulator ChaC